MDNNGMYDSLLEKVRHFVALYEKVKAEKGELEQKNISLQKQVSFLQNENNQLKTDNELLNMKLSEQNKKVVELSEKVSSQNNVNSEIESKLMAILSALPDDKDDSSNAVFSDEQNAAASITDSTAEQNVTAESEKSQSADEPQQEEDPADAILSKFMSYDTGVESDNNNQNFISFPAEDEAASSQNTAESDNGLFGQNVTAPSEEYHTAENESSDNANNINEYAGLFDEPAETAESAPAAQPMSLFGDTLPTEEEWNTNAEEQAPSEIDIPPADQNDNRSVMSFFDEQNEQNAQNETFAESAQELQSAETANMTENEYAANDIQSDDYSSILLSDDDSDEEVDFDMDDDESDEADEDVSGGDFEDGYAPGVM